MAYKDKTCTACSKRFQPTSGKQQRCARCVAENLRSGAPPCGCGCGEKVSWSRRLKGWCSFAHGHALRVFYEENGTKAMNQPAGAGARGGSTFYKHRCTQCRKKFRHQNIERQFCSVECSGVAHSGSGSHLWRGGKPVTKYVNVNRGGVQRRQHLLIMEDILKRSLSPDEVVHHIDEDGLNNVPSNLHLFHCTGCHTHFHKTLGAQMVYIYQQLHT